MKKNVKEKKRILSLILAVVMVVTMMPMQAVAAATDSTVETTVEKTVEKNTDQTEKEQQPAKTGDEKDGDNPAVSVKWLPDTGEREDESKGDVQLEASLNKNGPAASADVEIRLDKEEADALAQFRNEEGQLDEAVKLTEEGLPEISMKKQENGDVHLCFTLDQDSNDLKQKIEFQVPENAEKDVEIEVTKEDVTVATEAKDDAQNGDEAEQVAFEFEGKVLSLSVPEKAAQDDEKNTPNDEENNDKEQNAPVGEENNVEDESKQPSADGQEPAKEKKQLKMDAVFANVLDAFTGNLEEAEKDITYGEGITQNVFWADNRDEEGLRPDVAAEDYWTLSYRMKEKDGDWESWTVLNGENGKLFDMDENGFPESDSASANLDGVNRYTINIKELPSKVIYTDKYGVQREFEVEWKVDPKAVNGYDREDVTEENLNTMKDKYECDLTEPGWYYVLKTEFAFDVAVRQGNKTDMSGIADAVKGHFQLMASCGENKEFHEKLKGPTETLNFTNGNPNSKMTYGNLWKYNLDGSRITYRVEEKEGTEEGKVEVQRLVPDYFAISYDNSEAPNYGAVVNKIHDGGTLYLTLTGKTDYEAVKKWNDEDVDNAQEKRPAGEVQLWRFRSGEAYTSAAPVRDAKGDILTITLDGNATQTIEFGKPEGLLGTGEPTLEKYDPEGYEYIYVAREYLDSTAKDGGDANSYDQIFGEVVEENGKLIVRDTVNNGGGNAVREDNNTFLYNGGTLTNRIADTVTVDGVKIWKAAAFQAEFEDVAVEVTLQSRPADEGEDTWQNTKEVEVLDDFYAENLSGTKFSRTMPKYDDLGRELEYRWVESKVTQGNSANLLEEREDGLYFTLNQSGKNVLYRSDSTTDEETGTLTVINSIADTIRYDVEKVWVGEDGEKIDAPEGAEVTFKIYRAVSGEGLGEPVAEFTMDGEPDSKETLVNKKLGIYAQETESWKATVKPLAEYDEEGCVYEYTLLETGDLGDYIPTYKTERDEDGNYKTTVYNGHGGNRIMVRKEWTDNSDTAHRGKVKVNVYVNKNITTEEDGKVYEKDQQIGTAILGENGVWNKLVGIGYLDPEEDVYILEEKVGDTKVPLTDYLLDSNTAPNYEDPEEPDENTTIQYQTEEHKYEATYYKEKVENESIYTVDNRRLGNVDLTAVKTWTDGKDSGKTRSELREALNDASLFLAMKVNFSEMTAREDYYEITREGYGDKTADTVTIAPNSPTEIKDKDGKGVSSVQNISFADDTSEIYFYNLPKYDKTGKIVNYEIKEVVVDQDGRVVDWNELKADYKTVYEALTKYQTSVTQTSYVVGELHDSDKQTVDVTNRLQGNKDIKWYKKWKDDYVFNEGQRPDIYLDIYQVKHVQGADGKITTETSIFQKDYKWTAEDENQKYTYWTVTLDNVPKYDSLGYEIMYYAVEKTKVNDEEFDYADVAYEMNGDPAGTETVQEKQDNNYTIKVDDKYYALQEDGTFINSIFDTVTIRGQKVWSSLPSGYEDVNLPTVTFKVLQKVSGETGDGKQIATLTIKEDQWVKLKSKGSYVFKIKFEGENVVKFNNGTPEFVSTEEHPIELPKYNSENGKLYSYELDEDVTWPEGWTSPEWTEVYDAEDSHTYRMDNVYNSTKGSLGIKKFLYLPMENDKPEAYPAVEFKLTRTYTDNTGETVKDTSFSKTEIWTSDEVEEAYEKNENSPVEWTHTFENLDIYAPNGSPYIYTVEEVKTNLNGYETYAGEGDLQVETCNQEGVKVEGLQPKTESEIQATFKNQQNETEKVTLKGKKIWQDYSDAFGFRPDDIELTVTRSADSQPDQDNGMDQDLNNKTDYDIKWTKSGDTWTYEIKGTGNDELEKYAPNGMVWKYQVTEQKDSDSKYNVTPSDGTVSGSNDGKSAINMADLTNSIKTSEPFTKKWVDSDGKTITDDYLGTDLTVTFKLQAADKPVDGEAAKWMDAGGDNGYFRTMLSDKTYNAEFSDYIFETTKTGRINDANAWKTGYFSNLPTWIKDKEDNEHEVDYRVVEVSIQYGNSDPKATQNITVIEDDGTTYKYKYSTGIFEWGVSGSVKDTETIHTNRLPTTDITVEKVWKGDNNNLYNTRPDTGRTGYDWETTFVIQKSVDNQKWENVRVKAANESAEKDLTITLYGTNSDKSVEAAIEGLPKTDLNGKDYTYRARELNTDQDQTVLKNEDTYNKTYTVTYDDPKSATDKKTTATNTLNSTKIYGEKQWNPGTLNAGKTTPVKLTAQYKTASGWKTVSSPVTVDGTPASAAVMDPTSSQYVPFHEYESWKAVWNDLPEVMPGSELKDGKTQYRVIETVPSGYVQEDAEIGKVGNYPSYIYKNVEAVSYSVEKVWGGTVKGTNVVVGLYRTITDSKGTDEDYVVKNTDGSQKTVTLNKDNSWKGNFTGLPKYDKKGNLYTYYARELTIDGKPANKETIDYIYDIVYHDQANKTKIVNIVKIDITGTKTWKDNNDTYETRPDTLTLTLYRQAAGSAGNEKVNATPEWTKNGNVWTYTYKDLPATDRDGKMYTYTVEESIPKPVSGDDRYTLSQSGNNLTNTLTGEISISGEKVWRDGNDADGKRPDSITVVLYKNGTEFKTKTIDSGDATADETWSYTFSGLDEYDTEGKRITYTVDEVLPEGYSRTVNGNTITNTQLTSLDVEKVWGGVETDAQKEVVVGLYRTTGEKDETKDAVKGSDGKQITLALNSGNGWKGTFDDLAKYDVDGDGKEIEYTYYARELTIGGNPVKEADLYKVYDYDSENEQAATYATKIVNVGKTSITGSKTWVDNGNAYQNRPDKLELTLTRQIQGGETETVNVKPTWKDTDTDKWTYTYSDLPAADEKGNKYTYKVTETVPTPKDAATSGDEYADTQNGTDFTNTLTDKIDISGEKVWRDGGNADNKRPEKITVILYANDKEVKRQEITGNSTAGSWKYTFENLDEYDKDGKRITYTVDEVLPNGYTNKVTDLDITNTQLTSLDVEKVWGGVETADQKEVVVGLYRTTGEKDETKDAVKGSDGKQVTLALNSGNGWKDTFDDLAKYDVDGDGKEIEYTYYARELTIGGEPAEKADLYIHNHDGEAKDTATYTTKIVNVGKTSGGVKLLWSFWLTDPK
ncbi:Cna B-type domain-containing protein [Zhenpiania hominis]|uniref:Cna B-type domain-containing protein n=1 Tax=Zhenpiania hominis TaxID=2763644 RepID=A0A923NJB4_9FIRM|nr:Cna B-type domain-containing protein [Zhenpiania hominis]MBC6680131.1 Cna B-type domain-containing protein [Zhenpiania hominis]